MDQSFIDNSTGRIQAEPDTSSNSTRCFGNFLIAANQVAGFCESTIATFTVRADGGEARRILKHKYDTHDLIAAVDKEVKSYLDAASGKKEKEALDRMNGIEEEKGTVHKIGVGLAARHEVGPREVVAGYIGTILVVDFEIFCKMSMLCKNRHRYGRERAPTSLL